MSKKSKTGILLLSGLLAFSTAGALASCGEDKTEKDPTPVEPAKPTVTALAVANKTDLEKEWWLGEEETRTINLTVTPSTITQDDKRITITSSDDTVVKVTGRTLKAVGTGSATITVKADNVKKTFKVNVTAEVTDFTIENETELKTNWIEGDPNRTISVKTTPALNTNDLIQTGRLKVTSSAPTKVSAEGLVLSALAPGKATITVTYKKNAEATAISKTFDVNVIEMPIMKIVEAFKHAQPDIPNKWNESKSTYKIKALVLATNGVDDALIFDGTNFALAHSKAPINPKVGYTYVVKGKIQDFFGNLQIKDPKFDNLPKGEKYIDEPSASLVEEFTIKTLKDYKDRAIEVNDGIKEEKNLHLARFGKMEYEVVGNDEKGKYILTPVLKEGETWEEGVTVRADAANLEAANGGKRLFKHQKAVITGGICGYNNGDGYKYFTLLATKLNNFTFVGDDPTTVKIDLTDEQKTIKKFEKFTFRDAYKFDKDTCVAPLDWVFFDFSTPDMLDINGEEIIGKKAGTFKVKVYANKDVEGKTEIVSSEIAMTVSAEVADTVLGTIEDTANTKTLAELKAMGTKDSTTVDDKLFVTTAQIVGYDTTSKYGKVTLKDGETEITTRAFATDLHSIKYTSDGKISDVKQEHFLDFIGYEENKLLTVGDTVKVAVWYQHYVDGTYQDFRYYANFIEVTSRAETVDTTFDVTKAVGATVTPEKDVYKVGDKVTVNCTYAADKIMLFNDELVKKSETNQYEFILGLGANTLVVKEMEKITGTALDETNFLKFVKDADSFPTQNKYTTINDAIAFMGSTWAGAVGVGNQDNEGNCLQFRSKNGGTYFGNTSAFANDLKSIEITYVKHGTSSINPLDVYVSDVALTSSNYSTKGTKLECTLVANDKKSTGTYAVPEASAAKAKYVFIRHPGSGSGTQVEKILFK